jgi:hypothetical protein
MEENQVEQTAEPNAEVQETEQKQVENTFTQDQVTEIVKKRLAQERSQMYKKLGVDDIDIAVTAVKTQKDLEEKQKIQKGEFEEILKNKTQEWNKERTNLEGQLKDIKINKSLLSSASKNKAINPDQVVSLLQSQIKLNEEFLTQNPHFVSATPSGSGTVSNVDRQELNKPLNLSDLDIMNNPEDRKKYAEYRKQRNSKPRTIVVNN